jgi:uncharacterized damage-inducible protein DinB
MNEVERITGQLKLAFQGEAWHGPAVMDLLEGITAQQAASKPIPAAHSIWEIALHIEAWEKACLRRLGGDRAELTDAEDWPAISGVSEQAWEQCKAALRQGNENLQNAVSRLDESGLEQPIAEGMPTVYVTLHGVIQHDLYHAGQIAILKKAALEVEKDE